MSQIKILVAEDDENILTGLTDTLESEGYIVTSASDGLIAIEEFNKNKFDLILLDIMMPGKSGYDVCREIRLKDQDVPVIMLTAKSEEIDKVVGLQLGADDYVTKPFGVHELLARIAAVLRRSGRNNSVKEKKSDLPSSFKFGKYEIDSLEYRMRSGDNVFDITLRELQLLLFFSKHPNEVLTRDQLLNEVWGIDYYGTTRTLDQHIAKLRKKIEKDPSNPVYISTVHGLGYRYNC